MKSTQPSLVLIGLHDFLIFSNRTAHAWSVEAGNICSVSVFFVRVGSQISLRRAKKDSNIPSAGRTRSVKYPTPRTTKAIKSPPHALPPPPRRHNIDRCIRMLQKLFSIVLSIYSALWKNVSLTFFRAVKLFWLQSEKREIDLNISTWAFSCSFPVCLALLMLVYFTNSDEKWKTKMMFLIKKKSSQDLQEGFFFQKVLTYQSLVVSRFLDCSQSPVFPQLKKKIVKIQRFALRAAIGDTRYAWNQDGCPYR